jgi:hypothetical protein
MDTSTYSGNEIKRTPQNFWQEIEQGVPVMRENVPRSKIQPQ